MEVEIRQFFKDEYFSYHCTVDNTGITLFATNKHGEVVSEKWLNINQLKDILDH